MRALLHAVLVVGLLGCSESSPESAASGGSSGGSGTGGNAGSAGTGDSGPVITNVLVTGALDVDTKSVTLTVDVVDPDGQGDIVGGKLYAKDKAKFLGPFSQVSAGTFSYSLSWQALSEAETVILAKGATTARTVWIEFTDTSGKSASAEKSLELNCSACGPDCRACGGKCTTDACAMCEPPPGSGSCDAFCGSVGMVCACALAACTYSPCAVNACSDPCPSGAGCACSCI